VINTLLPFIVTGLATGSVFALAAMGLVLTYKTSGVFNLAHGALAAVGAYVMWELWKTQGWPWPVALIASVLLAGVIGGLLFERIAVGLADKPTALRVVATVGALIALQGLLVLRYGSASIPMKFFLPARAVHVLGVNIRYEQIIVFLLALGAAAGLTVFFRRSRTGIAMQGVVDDPALLGLQGTSPLAVRRSAWVIGAVFAAASGALLAPTLNLDATLLTLLVVQAFGAAAIGRFSSLPLTYVGGIVIGVGQELLKYLTSQHFLVKHVSSQILQPLPSNLPFVVLFVALIVTPRRALVERGLEVLRKERPPAPLRRSSVLAGSAAAAAGLIAVPAIVQASRMPVYTTALAYVAIFASLHLLVRTSGQVSLCQMAFAAVGAAGYVHAHQAGAPFALAVLFGGLIAVPVGAFISIPAIRLSGVYLAVATFGFGILMQNIAFPSSLMFGSSQAASAPRPAGASGDTAYYYVVLLVAAFAVLIMVLTRRSRLGRLLRGLADSPAALAAHGASTSVVRLFAFCISAFLAGLGGAVLAPVTGSATGGTFNFGVSLTILAVLVIAGRRAIPAMLVAAALYIVVPGYITNATLLGYLPVAFGVAAIVAGTGALGAVRRAIDGTRRALERTAAGTVSPFKARSEPVPPVPMGMVHR
jgi:branched-subunit amino acid ABC-type transport system permease component